MIQEVSMQKPIVLVVDDNTAHLQICKTLIGDRYTIYVADSAKTMFDFLESILPDLILLDIMMPTLNGFEAVKQLKDDETYCNIPVIFLSSITDESSEAEGYALGAADYIHKPFVPHQLIRRIDTQLELSNHKKDIRMLYGVLSEMLNKNIYE